MQASLKGAQPNGESTVSALVAGVAVSLSDDKAATELSKGDLPEGLGNRTLEVPE